MIFDNDKRPAWLNWVFLAVFLWSSWQLAGMWFSQLHQGEASGTKNCSLIGGRS